RIWFGWGRFGRSRLYDDGGGDITLSDGYWIVTMGQFGLLGFLAKFGLLALSVFRARSALKFANSGEERHLLSALMLIVAVNIFDLVPNAIMGPWTWLLVGSLLGCAEEK